MTEKKKGRVENFEGKRTGRPKGKMRPLPPAVKWVLDHMEDQQAVKKGGVQSGWVNLLKWCQKDEKNRDKFMQKVMAMHFEVKPDEEKNSDPIGQVAGILDGLIDNWEKQRGTGEKPGRIEASKAG